MTSLPCIPLSMHPFSNAHVVCIACGVEIPRHDAREYDRYGDRFKRRGKRFEYLCERCDAELCHHPREGVEARLCAIESAVTSRTELVRMFLTDRGQTSGQKD